MDHVLALLDSATQISVTLDLWSNRQMRSYIGITAHFVSCWTLHSAMLSCNRFIGRHTGERIYDEYETTMELFKITSKVKHVITDHASNMMKAFNLPGYERNEEMEEDDDTNIDEEDIDFTSIDDYNDSLDLPVEHHGCFAHALQLIVKDGFKKAGQVNRVIAKCSKLVSHVRKSTVATEILELEKKLQIANSTRWNSQLKMIRSVLAVDPLKLEELKEAPTITLHERNILKDLIEILSPFEEATDFAQIQNHPSAGYVIPCIRGLRHQLICLQSKFNTPLVTTLKLSLEERMTRFETDKTYQMAGILDPRFKLLWCQSDSERTSTKSLLINEAKKVASNEEIEEVSQVTQEEVSQEIEPPRKKARKLFSFMDEDRNKQKQAKDSNYEREVSQYLAEPVEDQKEDPLNFWKNNSERYPHLSKLSSIYLAVPASSAPVERLFSIAGNVFRPERCRLSDSTFEKLMFIRCNKY